tara:strand:- start:42 stop:530 length:489 start_codon:yes stop_codon:yes gene_type:complete
MSTLEVKAIQAPTGYNLDMPAGHIVQTVETSSISETNVSNASTGTSATEWFNTTITPKKSGNKLICLVTGYCTYGAVASGESHCYITYSASGVSETVESFSIYGNESYSSRPKLPVITHGVVTTTSTNAYTIRVRVNGRDVSANAKNVQWGQGHLTIMEVQT